MVVTFECTFFVVDFITLYEHTKSYSFNSPSIFNLKKIYILTDN